MIEYWVYYKESNGSFGIFGKFLKREIAEYVIGELERERFESVWIEEKFEPDFIEEELEI